MNMRWKRWLAVAAGLLLLYTLAGFWLVPRLIADQLPKFGQSALARQVSVGAVSFNPYSLRLEALDLRLAEADGAPLLAIGKLAVELQWRSLFRRAWSFAEIHISAPSASLVVAPDGKFNIAELLAVGESRPQEAAQDKSLPRLIIERFTLEKGELKLRDRRAGYAQTFSPIEFSLSNFSTLPDQSDRYSMSAVSAGGGRLSWKGEASLNPIRGSGELSLENASLPDLAAYLKPYTRATLAAGQLTAIMPYRFSYSGGKLEANIAGASVKLRDLALARPGAKDNFAALAQLEIKDINADLARRAATVGQISADGGNVTLKRDAKGQLDLAQLLVKPAGAQAVPVAPAASIAAGSRWSAAVKSVELSNFSAEIEDAGSGVKVHLQELAGKLTGVSNDLRQPLKFAAALKLREGGQLSMQGRLVPDSGELEAQLKVTQLALAPLQTLLGRYVKLKIGGGSISAQGQLSTAAARIKGPALRYVGSFDIAGLALKEESGELFAAWKNLGAEKLSLSLAPNQLEIAELRLVEPDAKLIIEDDRSFNAARLLVQAKAVAGAVETPPQAPAADEAFPVRVRRLRLYNAKLDFSDLSLRPQFAAKIYELSGVVTGLSSKSDARSQIELDGRVDEFGLARIRGALNPFAPRDNTDLKLVFKNVDMVSASPYAMKFAGYRITEGKISLDLQYRVRNSQLEGANQIIIDKLTLGERVDSPDALKLPLELAIAILKDSDGRIDLGLPVSGNMNDPQFSYGAVIWKAVGNVLTKIVTAPFRALGSLFGINSEKLEAIDFDPGSDKLLPPEQEKLQQLAQLLAKRVQLKLAVPGQYSEAADGAAIKARSLKFEVLKRAGIKLEAGEEPGALDLRGRAVRAAMRALYGERFGAAELEQQKKLAETAAPAGEIAATDPKTKAAQEKLPLWARVGKLVQGEPQVADSSAFYRKLQERLELSQPLAAGALSRLGAARASAILAALSQAGVDPARLVAAAPENINTEPGQAVSLKLGLAAK